MPGTSSSDQPSHSHRRPTLNNYERAMVKLARKYYPVAEYGEQSDERLLRWLSEDAEKAYLKAHNAKK